MLDVLISVAFAAVAAATTPAPRFLGAEECAMCHTRIPEPGKKWNTSPGGIGPYALWYGSAMARAGTDPFWAARVEAESRIAPGVEDECLRCHAPAQQYSMRVRGEKMRLAQRDDLGRDGVTCTVCHQIAPEGLGKRESFTGGFRVGTDNRIFGPHREPFEMPMRMHTGFTPTESRHISEAALCGSCHTVITHPPKAAHGSAHGPAKSAEFVEQGPYLEWLAGSGPRTGQTCQSCHMPPLRDPAGKPAPQYIAHRPPGGPFPPTEERSPFHRHTFAGGNTILPRISESEDAELWMDRVVRQLRGGLRLSAAAAPTDTAVRLTVDVRNLTGHKLPTGYPRRRLWLHVIARDGKGRTVFESGGWDPATATLAAGESAQPHYAEIDSPQQVQVFEARTADSEGRSTASLVESAAYSKDTRILPDGFDPKRLADAGLGGLSVEPVGVVRDAGFDGGFARTVYTLPAAVARIEVRAMFQTMRPGELPPGFRPPVRAIAPVTIGEQTLFVRAAVDKGGRGGFAR